MACLVAGGIDVPIRASDAPQPIPQVIQQTGVDRGICSVVGLDPKVVVPLIQSKKYLVHLLLDDPVKVAQLRKLAEQTGLGIDQVLIEQHTARRLPYASNMIDLLLVIGTTSEQLDRVEAPELLRVLRPEGVAVVSAFGSDSSSDVNDRLKKWAQPCADSLLRPVVNGTAVLQKPAADGAADWPLWQHGPDNNPVAPDQLIKAPYLTQFMADPMYITMPAVTTVAGGRTFLATGNIAHHRREWPWINQLIARNGFNGSILWQRPLPDGFMTHRSAYVATANTLYLINGDGCLKLDAATGAEKGRITIPGVPGDWKWMVLSNDVLYVMTGPHDGQAKVVKGDRSFGGWSWADLSPGYYVRPRVPWGFGHALLAYDLAGNKVLWKHEEKPSIDSRALALVDGKLLVYCPDKYFRCLDAHSGKVLWTNQQANVRQLVEQPGRGLVSTPGFRSECLALATPDAFVVQGQTRMNVVALSTADGKMLWTKKKFTNNPNAIYIDGYVVLGVGPRGSHVALDPVTGEVVADYNFRKVSCTRLTGCPDALFVRGEGTLRFDRATEKVLIDGGIRPACNDGALPANGMLYLGPWQCDCNLSWIGAIARCSAGDFRFDRKATDAERLIPGAAPNDSLPPLPIDKRDWPTYRANVARSASTSTELATPGGNDAAPTPQWTYTPPQPTVATPPIAAGIFVVTAGSDGYVRALSAGNGQVVWQFATGGPIKAAPTLWQGRLYVGSGDGYVYCLAAANGQLLWRFRAAPVERRIMVYGHLSSTWPVNTGILVHDGVAYFAAGIIDTDGTHVYALDARSGKIRWQNNSCGHLSTELAKGVSAAGNLSIVGDELLMAGGNQVNPARFDLATGECRNPTFAQGQPKANHGRFVGVLANQFPIAGGRILYASPRNVANKDSFVLMSNGRQAPLAFGGVPPAWNDTHLTLVNFRNGKLTCYDAPRSVARIAKGITIQRPTDRPAGGRWTNLGQAFTAAGALQWQTDLDKPNRFEVLAMALTPSRVVAVVQFQDRIRAWPQWQVAAFNAKDGTPIWFWRHTLPGEPLPEALAVGRRGQVIVTLLDGRVLSLAPLQPQRRDRR